jgi:transposase
MTHSRKRTPYAERVEIGERWEAGASDPEIAAAMNRSIWTVRKWRRKYQHEGRTGLVSKMGRPASGALGQFPRELRDSIREMREEHPGWGAQTILTELRSPAHFAGLKLPSRSRIAAFLKQEGYTQAYEKHSELPQPPPTQVQKAHEEWEMDAKGVLEVAGLGPVSIINIGDFASRLKIASLPCLNRSHPSTPDYQLILRRAFVRYGLPERISLDHDSVFYDNASASPFPTTLHLWLVALGVAVRFITQRPPAEHSFIERLHQTVVQQAVAGQTFTESHALQRGLDQRLDFLNQRLPCRTLDDQPPLVACPEARHSGRRYRLELEEDLLDMQRVADYLAQGRWFRQVSAQGQCSLGAHRYGIGCAFARQTLEITFDPRTRELVCLSEDGQLAIRFPIQGFTKARLMGELSPLSSLPAYQLALPLSASAWREMSMAIELTGTTL